MENDATPLLPWQRVGDSDYMSTKVLVWATLLRRASDALEEADDQLRDVPSARETKDRLVEAMKLVSVVAEDLRPLSVYLSPAPRSVEVVPE
jgi:hypothetical protein